MWNVLVWLGLVHPRPPLSIELHAKTVGYAASVRGKLRVPLEGVLQVFVCAEDDQWYLQPDVERAGNMWRTTCFFGFPGGPIGHSYTIVAVVSAEKVTTSPLADLPTGLLESAPVHVQRVS